MRNLHLIGLLCVMLSLLSSAPSTLAVDSLQNTATPTPDTGVELTKLPLGDSRLSDNPKVGWIWPCHIDPNAGGAFRNGPWIDLQAGTYDYTAKAVVDGAVTWADHYFEIQLQGDKRVITSNDLPDHATGIFPIASGDDSFQYDRNPNHIAAQKLQITIPANPTLADRPSCAPGAIGIMLTGVALFNALDGPGRDAVAHEIQDSCQGHPERTGSYHYHNVTSCIPDKTTEDGHSGLVGYSLDGFGIYGYHDVGGTVLTSADLDACHGHTHEIEWDGKKVVMYHYHATWDFPYTIGCMRGTYNFADSMALSGGPSGRPPR